MATREALKSSARVAYSVLFSFSLVTAWILRDFAKPLISRIPWIVKHFAGGEAPPDEWFGQQAVYRLSMGNFLLFALLAVVMSFPGPVKYKSDWRDRGLHHGGYPIKVGLWLVANVLPFFFPNSVVGAYAWVARFCSPLFLGIQMLIIIDMAIVWNESWVEEGDRDERYLYALLAATVGAYAGALSLAGLSYHWFAPSGQDCSFNISVITLSLLLCLAFTLLTFHPAVRGGNPAASLFVSACVALYVTYLGYSALQSEPRDYECNALGHALSSLSGTTLAAGMALTLLSTVWAAFRAGSNTRTFDTGAEEESLLLPMEETMTSAGLDSAAPAAQGMERGSKPGAAMADFTPVTYNYAQFYCVFALASMYVAMLMTGWGSGTVEKDLIDVGWTSVWVKVVSQWAAAALFTWTLAAPSLFPDRSFD